MKVYEVLYPTGKKAYYAHDNKGTFFDGAPSMEKLRRVHGRASFEGVKPIKMTIEEYRDAHRD